MLTKDKFLLYKRTVKVYPMQTREDEYGHIEEQYDEGYDLDTPVMITPEKQDEAYPKSYGMTDYSRFEFVYYGVNKLKPLDKVIDGDNTYKVVAVTPYQTHKVVKLEMLQNV